MLEVTPFAWSQPLIQRIPLNNSTPLEEPNVSMDEAPHEYLSSLLRVHVCVCVGLLFWGFLQRNFCHKKDKSVRVHFLSL